MSAPPSDRTRARGADRLAADRTRAREAGALRSFTVLAVSEQVEQGEVAARREESSAGLWVKEATSPRESALGLLLFLAIAAAVFGQLFANGDLNGLSDAGDAVRLAVTAGVALFLAVLLAPWSALRAPLALPVLALTGLTVLTFIVPQWTDVAPEELTRLGLLSLSYSLLAMAGVVLAARFGPLPILLLVVVTATIAGAMGLWGYAIVDYALAGVNQGEFVPQGPFPYRNTLALLAAAALLPLGRWAVPDTRNATAVAISIASGVALGVSAIVVALSLSEFALVFAAFLVVSVLAWPGPSLGLSVHRALAPLFGAAAIALASWFVYRKALPLPPDPDGLRLTLMILLVAATPLLIWGFSALTGRLTEGTARRFGLGFIALGALTICAVAIGPGLPTGSIDVRIVYYEVIIDTLREEPLIGVGPGRFAEASFRAQVFLSIGNFKFAHSIPGEVWIELGLAGLLATILLYVGATRNTWRSRRIPNAVLLAPLVLGFLLSGLIDWSWHISAMTALWAAGLGTVAGSLSGVRPLEDRGASAAGVQREVSSRE